MIPHFDRFESWMPGLAEQMLRRTPAGARLVGIDEDTALVRSGVLFTVRGENSVWLIDGDGKRQRFAAGEQIHLATAVADPPSCEKGLHGPGSTQVVAPGCAVAPEEQLAAAPFGGGPSLWI